MGGPPPTLVALGVPHLRGPLGGPYHWGQQGGPLEGPHLQWAPLVGGPHYLGPPLGAPLGSPIGDALRGPLMGVGPLGAPQRGPLKAISLWGPL